MKIAANGVTLISGGNVIKQGDETPFVFELNGEKGEVVDLTGATVEIKLANSRALVVEKQATVNTDNTVSFSLGEDDVTGYGDMRLEFIVTYPGGIKEKFPADGFQRIKITPSLEYAETGGIAYVTVEQIKQEFQQQINAFKSDVNQTLVDVNKAKNDAITATNNANQATQRANQSADNADSKAQELEQRVNQAIASGTIDLEVKDARGGFDSLRERLDKEFNEVSAQLAQTEIEIKKNKASTRNIGNLQTMVTFIDDDGYDGVLDILKPMFTSRGVPCVIALKGDSVILQTEEKREQLRDLQNNYGWEMASHTMTHIRLNEATDKEIEEDCINFLNLMHEYGLNVETIVYPWGEKGNTAVISKYYRAGFVTSNGVNNGITLDDYNIGREILGNSPSRDLQFFKDMIDSIEGKPRWLVFMTHVSDPATDVQQIEDVLDYVISKNIPIVTASEGLRHYGSLVSSQTNYPSHHIDYKYTRIKPNGYIDTNRYLMNSVGDGISDRSDKLPSEFEVGTTTQIFSSRNRGDLPTTGTMITIKPISTNGYAKQLLLGTESTTNAQPAVYYRTSLSTDDSWGRWLPLSGIIYETVTEDTPISEFPMGESIKQVTGWSLGNGTIKVIRPTSSPGYSRMFFYSATNDRIYTRRDIPSGWTDWKEI